MAILFFGGESEAGVVIAEKVAIGSEDSQEFREAPGFAFALVDGKPDAVTDGFQTEGKFLFDQAAALVAVHGIVSVEGLGIVAATNEKSAGGQNLRGPIFRIATKIRVVIDEHVETAYDVGWW
jgi:hypothetical protein